MALDIFPTVTELPNGVIAVTSSDDGLYQQIQASMGSYNYKVNEIYIHAQSNSQLMQGLSLQKRDANGNIEKTINSPVADPYQFQTSIFVKPEEEFILDGKSDIALDMLPNSTVNMVLYVTELSNTSLLMDGNPFTSDFYKDYAERL